MIIESVTAIAILSISAKYYFGVQGVLSVSIPRQEREIKEALKSRRKDFKVFHVENFIKCQLQCLPR
ncbi:MAG: hypothetical protein JG782_1793 [Anaerophaga sp.]|nr:hypothetical protein [Anaerophaga sp.]